VAVATPNAAHSHIGALEVTFRVLRSALAVGGMCRTWGGIVMKQCYYVELDETIRSTYGVTHRPLIRRAAAVAAAWRRAQMAFVQRMANRPNLAECAAAPALIATNPVGDRPIIRLDLSPRVGCATVGGGKGTAAGARR
jgi:hypothetical protein